MAMLLSKSEQRHQSRDLRYSLFESFSEKDLLKLETSRIERFFENRRVKTILDQRSVCVGVYVSMGSEAGTHHLREDLLRRGFCVAVPVMAHERMAFVRIQEETPLSVTMNRFPEPSHWSEPDIVYPDIVITPLLAFDEFGHRLGYGKGHYDRYFSELIAIDKKCLKVGWAYSRQRISRLSNEPHDTPLDLVITEQKTWRF